MKDLIAALTILLKYIEPGSYASNYPTNCSHDELWVNVSPEKVSEEDKEQLAVLGFDADVEGFISVRFGSC